MSIVFAMILGVYALIRICFRVRGQYRLYLGENRLPALQAPSQPPRHLNPELCRFFAHCQCAHTELSAQRRHIAKARLCDPDQYFGFLRDPRYRRSVIESASALRTWIDQTQVFFGLRHRRHPQWPVSPECAQSTLSAIAPQLHQASYSRALEPFALDDVETLDRALQSFLNKLEKTLDCLSQSHAVSYRLTPSQAQDSGMAAGSWG